MDYQIIIKDIRQKVGLDQAAFGNICGVGEQVIADIENGETDPSDTLIALLKYRYSDYFFRKDDHQTNLRRKADRQGRQHTREGILELFEDRQTARSIILSMAKMERIDPGVLREIKGVIRMMKAEQIQPNPLSNDEEPTDAMSED